MPTVHSNLAEFYYQYIKVRDGCNYFKSSYAVIVNYLVKKVVIMAAVHSRCGHYIFALRFLLLSASSFFFPRLISAVAEWMSTILLHMVWR